MGPGYRIRRRREECGLIEDELAARLARLSIFLGQPDPEITADVVARWEAGERISASRLLLLASVLNLPLAELLPALDPCSLPEWVVFASGAASMGDDGMLRREFVRLLLNLSAASAGLDLERLSATLAGTAGIDLELISQLRQSSRTLAGCYDSLPVSLFRQRAQAQLSAVKDLLAGSLPPNTRRELLSVGGECAVLAGWASRMDGRAAEAHTTFMLADTLARAAEDDSLRALVKVRIADEHSTVQAGGAAVEQPERCRVLLDAAEALAGPSAAPALRALIVLRLAEEHAAAGDVAQAQHCTERAFMVCAEPRTEFYGVPWSLNVMDSFTGNIAFLSGRHQDAVRGLEATLRDMPESTVSNRSSVLADLGAAQAGIGELDAACTSLGQAWAIADGAGLAPRTARVLGIRQQSLEKWAGTAEVRRLDEQLAG
jgi:transcriptional regulator with XRE-family HTH domain